MSAQAAKTATTKTNEPRLVVTQIRSAIGSKPAGPGLAIAAIASPYVSSLTTPRLCRRPPRISYCQTSSRPMLWPLELQYGSARCDAASLYSSLRISA